MAVVGLLALPWSSYVAAPLALVAYAVVLWLTEGRTATADTLRGFSREGFERGRAVAADIAERGRAGGARASSRWERLRRQIPGLRRRGLAQVPPLPPQPPALPPATS